MAFLVVYLPVGNDIPDFLAVCGREVGMLFTGTEIIKTNEQETQKAPSERLTDDLTNFYDKQIQEDQQKKKISQKASKSVKLEKLTRKQFFQLKPDILTTIKKQQFWIINRNNKNEIFTKSGSFYVPFLNTNPNEQLKRDIDFALDGYEDTQAESLF